MVSRALLAVSLGVATLLPSLAAAEAPPTVHPVVVVIEAVGASVDPVRVRARLAEELELPVLSIIEAGNRPTFGTLSVALSDSGRRAVLMFVPSDGTRYAVLVSVQAGGRADAAGEWLVAPCAAAIRTSEERRDAGNPTPELLDPWLAARVLPPNRRPSGVPREVIDPFVGLPRRRVPVVVDDYRLGEEVIDPWSEAVETYQREQAQHLAQPRSRRRRTP